MHPTVLLGPGAAVLLATLAGGLLRGLLRLTHTRRQTA
jgi:hypothetical protein